MKVKKNRVLPFKARLLDSNGQDVNDSWLNSAPVINIMFTGLGGGGATDVSGDALPAGAGTDGNEFEFGGSNWQFNLKTKNYSSEGTYEVVMVSGDPSEYTIDPECSGSFVID